MILDYKGYRIIQDDEDYRSISIVSDEKEVMHLSVTRLMSEGELIETVDECFKALGKLNTDDYIFGDELFYDGDEPC